MRRAIIFGMGVDNQEYLEKLEKHTIKNEFGTADYYLYTHDIVLMPRHGFNHKHSIMEKNNHLSNVHALAELNVGEAIQIARCGSITNRLKPNCIGMLDDFVSFKAEASFGPTFGYQYTDMSHLYDCVLRAPMKQKMIEQGIEVADNLVYACTAGPRLQTAAEVRAFMGMGCDCVGVVLSSETTLLRELCIKSTAVVYSSNWATGIHPEKTEFIPTSAHNELGDKLIRAAIAACKDTPFTEGGI
ncbi:MAG: hypothetical protein KBS83_03420 [Lachnospiraceae bacterium]|nr:hypothetical protein [Candidatus Equihabitans merdae]